MRTLGFFLCVAITLLAGMSAFADFVPGRVRPGYTADMKVVNATGVFAHLEGVKMTENFEDGNGAPVSFSIEIGGHYVNYIINNVKKGFCGDLYEADALQNSTIHNHLQVVDFRNATCERMMPAMWDVKATQTAPGRGDSELAIQGNPQVVFVTL
jgi:hypothetical protein